MLKETRDFAGCTRVDLLADIADPAHYVAYELWESNEHDLAYRAWRKGDGARGLRTSWTAILFSRSSRLLCSRRPNPVHWRHRGVGVCRPGILDGLEQGADHRRQSRWVYTICQLPARTLSSMVMWWAPLESAEHSASHRPVPTIHSTPVNGGTPRMISSSITACRPVY